MFSVGLLSCCQPSLSLARRKTHHDLILFRNKCKSILQGFSDCSEFANHLYAQRVDVFAARQELKIQVRSRSNARHSYQSDLLSLFDPLSLLDKHPLEMSVSAFVTAFMFHTDVIAIAVTPACKGNNAICNGPHRGSLWCTIINAVMFAPYSKHRMKAVPVAGGNLQNADRGSEEILF
ncbi:MAG: hypothetical protein QG577_1661 [Thermodesulfobacteriota bacterium]|nr:hypothetical protein [Thermodesulfobacteriota bacterium]